MSDKTNYLAASVEAFLIGVSACCDDEGAETGEFDTCTERCPIVAWRLEMLVQGGDPLAVPIIPGWQRMPADITVLCILADGSLWDIEQGRAFATLEAAETSAARRAHQAWISRRATAGNMVRIDGGRA